MGFSSKGVDSAEKKGISQFFAFGAQELMINGLEVKTSGTGSKNIQFNMETRPVNTSTYPDYKTHADAKNGGQIGRANMYAVWQKDLDVQDSQNNVKFIRDISLIADKLGVRTQLDAINTDSFDEYVAQASAVLSNGTYRWYKVCVEEYPRDGKAAGQKYWLGRYSKETIVCAETADKVKFDKTNSYDYKKAETPVTPEVTNDMPF